MVCVISRVVVGIVAVSVVTVSCVVCSAVVAFTRRVDKVLYDVSLSVVMGGLVVCFLVAGVS